MSKTANKDTKDRTLQAERETVEAETFINTGRIAWELGTNYQRLKYRLQKQKYNLKAEEVSSGTDIYTMRSIVCRKVSQMYLQKDKSCGETMKKYFDISSMILNQTDNWQALLFTKNDSPTGFAIWQNIEQNGRISAENISFMACVNDPLVEKFQLIETCRHLYFKGILRGHLST